jgi:hypothetical protein
MSHQRRSMENSALSPCAVIASPDCKETSIEHDAGPVGAPSRFDFKRSETKNGLTNFRITSTRLRFPIDLVGFLGHRIIFQDVAVA